MVPGVQTVMNDSRIRYASVAVVVLSVLALGWLGFSWHRARTERAAFKELAESLDAYSRIMMTSTQKNDLIDSERAFKVGAQSHTSSVLHPYFIAFQADALARLGKLSEAAKLLDSAVKEMDTKHPLYYLYALKAVLVKIDTKDAALEKEGRLALDALARDTANPLQEMAQYYSALDESAQDNTKRAQELLKAIVSKAKPDSYWYQLADSKLIAGD